MQSGMVAIGILSYAMNGGFRAGYFQHRMALVGRLQAVMNTPTCQIGWPLPGYSGHHSRPQSVVVLLVTFPIPGHFNPLRKRT